MVPFNPYYPTDDQHNNHYWGSGGWSPLAVGLHGKVRATHAGGYDHGDYTFNDQIIDLDEYYTDGSGESCASLLLGESGDGTVEWQFAEE